MPLTFKGNSRFVIIVKDYDACRCFYEEIINLEITQEWNRSAEDKGVVYTLGNIELEILQGQTNPNSENTYLYIQIENADAFYAKIKTSEDIITPIENQTWNHRNFMIKDPVGTKLKFFEVIEKA